MINRGYIAYTTTALLIALSAMSVQAQVKELVSKDYGYSYRVIPQQPIDRLNDVWLNPTDAVQEQVVFRDPLGRPVLETSMNVIGLYDVFTPYEFDPTGRLKKQYLPFPGMGDKGLISNPTSAQSAYYNGCSSDNIQTDSKAYSYSEYEASPLGRPLWTEGPGAAWTGKRTTYDYRFNTSAENVYTIEPGQIPGTFYAKGVYPSNALTVVKTTSPDGLVSQTFIDNMGRTVMAEQGGRKTYNVYDQLGRVAYVLPPLATERIAQVYNSTTTHTDSISLKTKDGVWVDPVSRLYYAYTYDDYGRLVEKSIPGKGSEEFVYDRVGRLILSRDGNTRRDGKWMFQKYDRFGRKAYSGVFASATTRQAHQLAAASSTSVYEGYATGTTYTLGNSYPTVPADGVLTEYHYDNHFTMDATSAMSAGFSTTLGSARGLLTMTRSRVLDTQLWVTSYFFYNPDGQLLVSKRVNGFRGSTQYSFATYSFTGQVVSSRFVHSEAGTVRLTLNYYFTYTHGGQVKTIEREIPGGMARELIAKYTYNALGEMTQRKLGGENALQQVDYFYNLRGWLTQINDVNSSADDLFSQKLHYADGLSAVGGQARYDGMLSGSEWRVNWNGSAKSGSKMAYGYRYDAQGRLASAVYASGDNLTQDLNGYNESFSFDANGNIQTLTRRGRANDGTFAQLDNLSYAYSGNRLNSVTDGAPNGSVNNLGFKELNSTGNDYIYDSNGNMKQDLNRGIAQITYNVLNLPTEASVDAQNRFTFTYTATGEKLRMVEQTATSTKTLLYDGPLTFDGTLLQSISTPEGRINSNGYSAYVQEYTLTDSQGNVRVTFDRGTDGTARVKETRHYYPSGLVFSSYQTGAVNKFGFGGKEEYGSPLGWLNFHARMYDPAIARWSVPDPLAELTKHESPYLYCAANPVNFSDPSGCYAIEGNHGSRWYRGAFWVYNSTIENWVTINLDGSSTVYQDHNFGGSPGSQGYEYNEKSNTYVDRATGKVINFDVVSSNFLSSEIVSGFNFSDNDDIFNFQMDKGGFSFCVDDGKNGYYMAFDFNFNNKAFISDYKFNYSPGEDKYLDAAYNFFDPLSNGLEAVAGSHFTASNFFREGYWLTKGGKYYPLSAAEKGKRGWNLLQTSLNSASNEFKWFGRVGTSVGYVTAFYSGVKFSLHPSWENGIELTVNAASMVFWEIGAAYTIFDISSKSALLNYNLRINHGLNPFNEKIMP